MATKSLNAWLRKFWEA
ncbi:hypothetical protein Goari_004298 [Gossypium aridum]|uniref:Uncharacterized protein n=1 Tax=Gossypium aridum TaxID=34290 RepID=A0A7J8Y3H6_GOSAI|nr:hypothetical protein [Gossypium aridum]